MIVNIKCIQCGQDIPVCVDEQEYQDYIDGKVSSIDAFPTYHIADRHLLTSHICARCWDDLFGVEPD